jgi:imidazolonepropionase-like amidohydrolase
MNGMSRRSRLSPLAVLVLLVSTSGTAAAEQLTPPRDASASPDPSIAITNVTVVDVATGNRQTGMTVVTKADDIVEVGRGVSVPPGTTRVDGTGRFLMPGLWDMHSHHQGTGAESVGLFVANGVVGTRDMGADVEFILPLRDRINRGELLGPEILATGPILDDRPSHWPFRRRVRNGQQGREAVRDLEARGVDFIKVHDGTPREAFFAIADEAKKVGLPLVGHVPNDVKVEEAVTAGMKSIEHFANYRVLNQCSANPPHNQISCEELFGMLSSRGVWQTPTITFFQLIPDMFSGKPLPHTEYASDALLELTRENVRVSQLDEQALSFFRTNNRRSLPAIKNLVARGIGFLAGCDGLVPGFCLHDELAWMTKAGLSPLQALQTATLNPARFLDRESTQGTVAVGKRADLVLLEADPLTDITHTRGIAAVIVRGRLLAKPDLERILAVHKRAGPER